MSVESQPRKRSAKVADFCTSATSESEIGLSCHAVGDSVIRCCMGGDRGCAECASHGVCGSPPAASGVAVPPMIGLGVDAPEFPVRTGVCGELPAAS